MDDDVERYGEAKDRFREALTESKVELAGGRRTFYLQIDPSALLDLDDWRGRRYARGVHDALDPVAEPGGLSLIIEPYGGPKTGGPIPDQQYVVGLAGFAFDWLGHIVDLAAAAVLVKALIERAREATENEVLVSEGFAIVLASEAILAATGEQDLVLAFATTSGSYTRDRGDFDRTSDGYMIGFRGRDQLYLVHVSDTGAVDIASPIAASWESPREWKNKKRKGR